MARAERDKDSDSDSHKLVRPRAKPKKKTRLRAGGMNGSSRFRLWPFADSELISRSLHVFMLNVRNFKSFYMFDITVICAGMAMRIRMHL